MATSKVCTSCGFTTDEDGRLIVNTGGSAWPYECNQANGEDLYCDPDTGRLHASPEKFYLNEELVVVHQTGDSDQLDDWVPIGVGPTLVGSGTIDIVNPSLCRPMRLVARFGLEHAQFVIIGSGSTEIVIGVQVTVTGAIADTTGLQPAGHQSWRHSTTEADFGRIIFDSQRPQSLRRYTLPPGGTATFTLKGNLDARLYNGNSVLQAWRSYLEVMGYSLGFGQVT